MKRKNGLTGSKLAGDVQYDRYVFGHLIEAGPRALNLVSNGSVPIGKPVPTPEILRHKPLRPPTRRAA
jgi:hypothetical protein